MMSRRVLIAALIVALPLSLPLPIGAQIRGDDQALFRASGIEVTVRYHDDRVKPLGPQIQEVVEGGLSQYIQLFGGGPRAADGSALVRLRLNVGTERFGGATTEPGAIALLVAREPGGFYDWRLLLLHELVHLWTTETFREASPAEVWFREGSAELLALRAAARLRLLDERAVLDAAADVVSRYLAIPPAELRALAQPSPAVFPREVDHVSLTAAMALDRALRQRTANARNLDDVLVRLGATHDRTRPYTNFDLLRAVRDATGEDLTEFFARHVMGRMPLPVQDTLGIGRLGAGPAAADSLVLHTLGLRPR